MKKIIPLLILSVSCSQYHLDNKEGVNRKINSEKEVTEIDYIDPKFESYWKESEAHEKKSIAEVANVIRKFVSDYSTTKEGWYEDYQNLKSKNPRELNGKERKKIKKYTEIFSDLPERDQKSFATRDVHRKDHGCYKAEVKIEQELPSLYSKGLFKKGEEYDGVIRFSSGNPNNNYDDAPDARGMALKLLSKGTLGDKSIKQLDPEAINEEGLLDILTINFPTFFVNDAVVYAKVNSYFLANDQDVLKSKKLNEALSVFAGGMESFEKVLALKVNGSIIKNPIYQEWFSMAPSRLGSLNDSERTAVKYMMEPCKTNMKRTQLWPSWSTWEEGRDYQTPGLSLKIPSAEREKMKNDRHYLRHNIEKTMQASKEFCYALYIQPFIGQKDTPIEDSNIIWHWDEREKEYWPGPVLSKVFRKVREDSLSRAISAPVKVAEIKIIDKGHSAHGDRSCEDLSFNPWNNVPSEHKPLGVVQRIKRAAYSASRSTRFNVNGVKQSVKD